VLTLNGDLGTRVPAAVRADGASTPLLRPPRRRRVRADPRGGCAGLRSRARRHATR
jgi:hypothetical protein